MIFERFLYLKEKSDALSYSVTGKPNQTATTWETDQVWACLLQTPSEHWAIGCAQSSCHGLALAAMPVMATGHDVHAVQSPSGRTKEHSLITASSRTPPANP
jgi:hypothetical protein